MKRRFALPIAVAAILHAALLLGFNGSPTSGMAGGEAGSSEIICMIPPNLNLVAYHAPQEDEVRNETIEQRQGEPDAGNLSLPDRPQPAGAKDFIIPVEKSEKVSWDDVARIKPGIVGVPQGSITGGWRQGTILDSGMLDNRPRAIVQPAPIYPGEAKIRELEGRVLVGFGVDENGNVYAPQVIEQTDRVFAEAALRAVARWRFEPGRRHGQVVRFKMAVPIVFSLND